VTIRLACLQMNSGPDVAQNLEFIRQHAIQAATAKVDILQLPECFAQMPASAAQQIKEVHGVGEIQTFLKGLANELTLNIVAGALPIVASPDDPNHPYARCVVIDSSGQAIGHYDKIHLFDVALPDGSAYRESDRFSPAKPEGGTLKLVDIAGVQLGLTICYDLRFPELYRALTQRGAQLFAVPSAFTYDTGRAHWETLLRARAIENLSYVFAAAQTGEHASGRRTWGHSMIIDPWGEVLAQAGSEPGLIMADISLSKLEHQREHFPALQHRQIN